MTDNKILRLDCLRLAHTVADTPEVVAKRARVYMDFVSGMEVFTGYAGSFAVPAKMPKRPYTRRAHTDNLHVVRKVTAKPTPKKK